MTSTRSAADTGLPGKTHSDLESDLMDAAHMARITVEFIGRALGFDALDPPKISRAEAELLSFAILQTCVFIEGARDTFHNISKEADHA